MVPREIPATVFQKDEATVAAHKYLEFPIKYGLESSVSADLAGLFHFPINK
jgi:hypothetical protein